MSILGFGCARSGQMYSMCAQVCILLMDWSGYLCWCWFTVHQRKCSTFMSAPFLLYNNIIFVCLTLKPITHIHLPYGLINIRRCSSAAPKPYWRGGPCHQDAGRSIYPPPPPPPFVCCVCERVRATILSVHDCSVLYSSPFFIYIKCDSNKIFQCVE